MRGQDYITCVHLIDSVQSRFMHKIICRLRLSEVSRQMKASSSTVSKRFMFIYFLLPHCVPAL